MTETQERFLRAIVARVPVSDVVEVHLFPPIRRGTVETGVAVLAVQPLALVEDEVEPRLRILTANYRATIKGVDRGKWQVDVQEEADAPLVALEAVLRGVRQRSEEPADPELIAPEVLHALVAPVVVAPAA
jgi:hypothetical protein